MKEKKIQFYLHDLCDLLPLVLGRVGAGRVVSAGVEDEDGVFWSFLLTEEEEELFVSYFSLS